MSVLSVKQGFTGVEAGGSESAKTTVEVYSIITNDPTDEPLDVQQAVDPTTQLAIPQPNEPHPKNANYRCGVPRISKISPTFFNVQAPYSTRAGEVSQASLYDDPLSEPADYNWTSAESDEPTDRDADGNPIVNVLGEPFDPPVRRRVKDAVLTISRNEAAFSQNTKYLFEDTVCAEVFWAAPIGKAKMNDIVASTVHAATTYWKTRYVVRFRVWVPNGVEESKAWYRRLLNQGYKYLDAPGGKLCRSATGSPVLLAADGTQTDAANAHWLEFKDYPLASWATLGINL